MFLKKKSLRNIHLYDVSDTLRHIFSLTSSTYSSSVHFQLTPTHCWQTFMWKWPAENKESYPTSASWRACCAPTGCWMCPSGTCRRGGGCALSSRHRQSCRSHYRGQQIDPGHPWPHWPLWCMALWGIGPDELQEKEYFLHFEKLSHPKTGNMDSL